MSAFQNILIALDYSEMDEHLINYLRVLRPDEHRVKLHFVHVLPGLEVPAFAGDLHVEPTYMDKKLWESMRQKVASVMQVDDYQTEFELLEGNPTRKLLEMIQKLDIDLSIVGKKLKSSGSGISARRLLRQSPSSVLFIPPNPNTQPKHILVPVDFSDYSVMALEKAAELGAAQPAPPKLTLLHIYDVSEAVYPQISYTYEEWAELIRSRITSYFPQFVNKVDMRGLECETIALENTHYNTATHIREYAAQSDLIVMGAKGHSALSSFFLGSVTERLLNEELPAPTLIVR